MNTHRPAIRKGRKYAQVLTGARDVFLRDGFDGASVDDIAKESGVSKATLYSYFPDKREMFIEMARVECQRQAETTLQNIDPEAPAPEVLTQIATGILQISLSDIAVKVFRICVAEAERFPELGRQFYETGPRMGRQRLAEFLRYATARGELNVTDCDMAAAQFQELSRAGLFMRHLFGISQDVTTEDIEYAVSEAVSTFMARYGA